MTSEDADLGRDHVDARLRPALERHLVPMALLSAVREEDGTIADLRCDFANEAVASFTGVPAAQLAGRGILEAFPPTVARAVFGPCARVAETGEPLRADEVDASDGERELYLDLRIAQAGDGCLLSFRDATDRHAVRARADLLTHLYATLSHVNAAIVAAADRDDLFGAVCAAAVEHGSITLAWIGEPDPATGDVRILAAAGDETGYLDGLEISALDNERGRGPTGTALREGRHVLAPDFARDAPVRPWRHRALEHGLRSSAAFPLRCGGQVVAAISLYAPVPRFFDEEEIRLLDQLAADVSFALDAFDQEERRRAAEGELARTAALLAEGEEVAGFGAWEWEADGDAISWSRGACRVVGLDPGERHGWEPLERRLGRERLRELRAPDGPLARALPATGAGSAGVTLELSGTGRVVQVALRAERDADERPARVIGTVQDVTERTRAEARAEALAEERRLLVAEALDAEDRERTRLSESLHDDTLQVLLAAQQELTSAARGDGEALARAQAHVEYAQSRLRELVADLSPVVHEFSSLSETIRTVARRHLGGDGVRVTLALDDAIATPHDRLLIRAAGELLGNVAKHAGATAVRVSLRRDGDVVELCVEDDGTGFEPDLATAVKGGHIGLASLTTRAAGVGGALELRSSRGGGTRACLRVPAA